MNSQYVETLIIGAGQAGLSTGYHLKRRGRQFLIVDGNQRIGDNWRQQWDTLRLYTPAKYDGLPGMPFPAARWHFPGKDEVGDYLERYALHFDLPVRTNTRVDALRPRPQGGYEATIGGATISCDNVVVATGSFGRTPNVPEFAAELAPEITQLHSSQYRRPAQLQPGPALVVGASHSGQDIAYELAPTRPTTLCGPSRGNIPFRPESRRAHLMLPVVIFVFRHVLTRRTPMGRKAMPEVRFHGGPHLRIKPSDLERRGVTRTPARVTGVVDGQPVLDDGTVLAVSNVVWCTGFRQVFDWIRLPVMDERGWPVEYRGVVDLAPGLFFCGLSFQYAFASMVFPGIGRDADYVARQIVARAGDAPASTAVADAEGVR
ncbi:flavin-containing monooxygenase [Phytohabitans aurantiacus]|uniref:Oxidoreductase n=1 Tax=Phytohabitans aurantiacus TaxID=3016789 RepID=A0ABQ5QNR0_9ACTN|nr:NAD(P)-binding domain-containing protein [Phytohabitans aurantiacus]GLH96308.1 oxidoreductase [Phytohabitans aurantiacus]